jgi:hypothetical protein
MKLPIIINKNHLGVERPFIFYEGRQYILQCAYMRKAIFYDLNGSGYMLAGLIYPLYPRMYDGKSFLHVKKNGNNPNDFRDYI